VSSLPGMAKVKRSVVLHFLANPLPNQHVQNARLLKTT